MAREFHNWLVNTLHEEALFPAAAQYLHGRLIDIGCGIKPYRGQLSARITEHVGVDHSATQHDTSNVDLFGTAYSIPAENCSFDSALCTFVLEHLEEPEAALRECHRILKPGGTAIYSVPFIWHLHEEPRDFYRFSKYVLFHLFNKTGFEILELKVLSGFWASFGQLLVYNLYRFNRGPLSWLRIMDGIGWVLQRISYWADRIDRTEIWTTGYLVVVRKP
jgi:SAM-dependent methyltransferase